MYRKSEPINTVLAKPATPAALREKLRLVLEMRAFARSDLGLEPDGHYEQFADLGRRYVVWNVYAAPEFALEPKSWWYPLVGRLNYRGFFSEAAAKRCADELARQGYDVHVGGVEAYSTLGWFKDPVLNTFIHNDADDLAETIFHELAHQRVFARGDTDFNEAFATTVGEEGTRRWLKRHGDARKSAEFEAGLDRKAQFVRLVAGTRAGLAAAYRHPDTGAFIPAAELRARKEAVLAGFRRELGQLRSSWGKTGDFESWIRRPVNNARLNTISTYHDLVPDFRNLLAKCRGDLVEFYRAADELARLEPEERLRRLREGTR